LAKDSFNDVTEAANALLLKGKIDIYQSQQSEIEAALTKIQQQQQKEKQQQTPATATIVPAPAKPPTVQWEYRGSQDHQIHGPYSSQDMLHWIRAGYFVGPSAVQVRTVQVPVSKPVVAKSTQEDLLSDLMDDDDDDDDKAPAAQAQEVDRGEWQMSDKVDFSLYM